MRATAVLHTQRPSGPGLSPGREQSQQRVHDGVGLFTWHKMARVSHNVPRCRCRKESHVTLVSARERHPVIRPVQYHRRHRDRRSRRQAPLDLVKAWVTRGIAVAVAIRVDHHWHEIGVVEGRCRAVEGGIVKVPGR